MTKNKPQYKGFKIRLECLSCGKVTEENTNETGMPIYSKEGGPELTYYATGYCETCAGTAIGVECGCGNTEGDTR